MKHRQALPPATSRASRRAFLSTSLAAAAGLVVAPRLFAEQPKSSPQKAQIAITLDLEMSRNFPEWETTHWDYEKGNLNDESKRYAVEACRRVKAAGGVLHCFTVARVLEQENVDWLKGIIAEGHPVGNHTYDHVNVLAKTPDDVQYRFKRSPWLIAGQTPAEAIRENIRLANVAMEDRLGIKPAGFRTPGGFDGGLHSRPDVQQMLLGLGFPWISCLSPYLKLDEPMHEPSAATYDAFVAAGKAAQPFRYPSGLIDVPMSVPSDITAFRGGRWRLEWFLEAVRRCVNWTIENRATFDLLSHPSCLYVTDPKFRTIDMICEMVRDAGDRAELVDVGTLAKRA